MEYARAFDTLESRLRESEWFAAEGWEVRREKPAGAYLHLNRSTWLDQRMNGCHFETYVLSGELRAGRAPVALHCEDGFPAQARFMRLITERIRDRVASWEGYQIQGPSGSSVCEVQVPLCATPADTCETLLCELERLRELTPVIDDTIAECLADL